MRSPKPAEGWAVVDPDGDLIGTTFAAKEDMAWNQFVGAFTSTASLEARGYRCVRVRIVPVAEKEVRRG